MKEENRIYENKIIQAKADMYTDIMAIISKSGIQGALVIGILECIKIDYMITTKVVELNGKLISTPHLIKKEE